MKITGIVTEYNPFHNGHIYHINKTREITNPDLLIAVMSGNFTQRGEVGITDKFERTKAALLNGVDLVVELPYIYTLQNAYVFAKESVNILSRLHIDSMVFGSETNNMEELKKFASLEIDVTRLKELMDTGESYPKAYGLLSGSMYSNDILAVAYLKALKDTSITPYSIERTNDYHSDELGEIASANAIRKALLNSKDISKSTPMVIDNPVFNKDLYPLYRHMLMTSSTNELSEYFLTAEGIENLLKKNAYLYDDYEEFISHSVSRRYTRSRIQRVMCHMLNKVKKNDIQNLENNYIRVLGFNRKGQEYLNSLRKEEDLNIITQFKNIPQNMKDIEWKVAVTYSFIKGNDYLKKELKGPVII